MIEFMTYTDEDIQNLKERTNYEAWLLEEIYKIVKQPIKLGDDLIYPPNRGDPDSFIYLDCTISTSDWRPGFLEVGKPFILVTSFKLLDMLIEWVLTKNGKNNINRFTDKKKAIKSCEFPPLIESNNWLRERLIALYEKIVPLRGTIIHDQHFESIDGTLKVFPSSKGTPVGNPVVFSEQDLCHLSFLLVSLIRYIGGTWTIDEFQENKMRFILDEIQHLHQKEIIGQNQLKYLTVRVYSLDEDIIEIDVGRMRKYIATRYPDTDTLFDVRVVVISRDGQNASAYLIPWKDLKDEDSILQKHKVDLASLSTLVPPDIDIGVITSELRM
ncbi:MAG: hypothetical protein EA395_15970 [Phormidium sp. GEM2.Bin31]|nr:MAG: hypothetical protein EA395_15970 [Phormidium sp. GEM2.Bin31]